MTKKLIALSLALLLLCPALCSCFWDEEGNFVGLNNIISGFAENSPSNSILGGLMDNVLGNSNNIEFEENEPYRLVFESKDNGTCAVTNIMINPNYTQPFSIVIPEKSSKGETVDTIAWGKGRFVSANNFIPAYIQADTFNAIINKLSGSVSDFELRKFQSYFTLMDLEQSTTEETKSQMLADYPITQYLPICVFDETASLDDAMYISRMIAQHYLTISSLYSTEYAEMVIRIKEQGGNASVADKLAAQISAMSAKNCSLTNFVVSIEIPDGISFVEDGCFENFYSEQHIVLPASASYSLVAELAKSDIFVFMDATNANYDWGSLYMAQQSMEDWKIHLYHDDNSSSTDSSYKFWKYSDGVPTCCDNFHQN